LNSGATDKERVISVRSQFNFWLSALI
jgi:hypothetical protein